MFNRASRTARYAAALIRTGGARAFFSQLARQIYSRDTLFGLEKALDASGMPLKSRVPYVLEYASMADIGKLPAYARTESAASAHELLERKWFYENGFRDCYIARDRETGEVCGLAWLVSAADETVARGFGGRLPALQTDEVLLENCYTFEKYRGRGIMPAMVHDLQEKARHAGFRHMLTYVRRDNTASLQVFKKLDFRMFQEISELKLFFRTKRNHD
jgi:GNAT superfamily N-acetyltransferase